MLGLLEDFASVNSGSGQLTEWIICRLVNS